MIVLPQITSIVIFYAKKDGVICLKCYVRLLFLSFVGDMKIIYFSDGKIIKDKLKIIKYFFSIIYMYMNINNYIIHIIKCIP